MVSSQRPSRNAAAAAGVSFSHSLAPEDGAGRGGDFTAGAGGMAPAAASAGRAPAPPVAAGRGPAQA
eukprot:2424213-Alexandrium_andersonii.AAC.1